MDYYTNSITIGGGESMDALLDGLRGPGTGAELHVHDADTTGPRISSTRPTLDHLSNDAENFGGFDDRSGRHALGDCNDELDHEKLWRISATTLVDQAGRKWRPWPARRGSACRGHRRASPAPRSPCRPTRATARNRTACRSTRGAMAAQADSHPCLRRPYLMPASDFCPAMQLPGPTLIVTEGPGGQAWTLTNNLPAAAGSNLDRLHRVSRRLRAARPAAGQMTASGGTQGLLAMEAAHGATVTYTLNTTGKGRHPCVLQRHPARSAGRDGHVRRAGGAAEHPPAWRPAARQASPCTPMGGRLEGGEEYRLAPAAYDHPATCYDREYLWQWG